MDSLYNTQFYSWIKNPQNREYAALRVSPLIQEYNSLSHTAHVLRWIASDWKPNEAKDLFRLVTDKWDDGKRRLLMFYLVRAQREEEGLYLKKRRRTGKSGEKEGDGREHSRYQWDASQVCDEVEIGGHRTLSGAISVPNTPTVNISMSHNNNNERRHGAVSSTRNDIDSASVRNDRSRPVVRSATWDSTSFTPSLTTLPYLTHVHPCQSHDAVFLRPIINSEPTRMAYPYSHGDRTGVVRNGIVYQAYPGYVNSYNQIQHERIGEESMKAMGEERRRRRRRNSDVDGPDIMSE
ncbi:1659_t:CDS:2 [Paraglomus brasilianum]|uniref:1659_t:CDS:1 n=1 Tax=Paraglomus brasilianum TaxID=144538 RepID=A0A9N9CET6_9GLOM|nr:1659_t:CDS:2 [Paraglomus brasilianum]